MGHAYLGANILSLALWLGLYYARRDLRRMMLVMSLCALPLALFDLLFVPAYWTPVTLLNMPIGIEGFLYVFSAGGVAAVVYAELAKRTPRHLPGWRFSAAQALWVPLIALTAFVLSMILGVPNPEIAAYIALATGTVLTLYFRKDLAPNIVFGSLAFGFVYFVLLKLWVGMFPSVHSWFSLQYMPRPFIWGVPVWEILYGFFFGAFWSGLYELLFGYKLVRRHAARTGSRSFRKRLP